MPEPSEAAKAMDDEELIARLRDYAANGCRSWNGIEAVFEDSAAHIKALTARLAEAEGLVEALQTINRKASPDPERTMSEASNDLYWVACHARASLAKWEQANV